MSGVYRVLLSAGWLGFCFQIWQRGLSDQNPSLALTWGMESGYHGQHNLVHRRQALNTMLLLKSLGENESCPNRMIYTSSWLQFLGGSESSIHVPPLCHMRLEQIDHKGNPILVTVWSENFNSVCSTRYGHICVPATLQCHLWRNMTSTN